MKRISPPSRRLLTVMAAAAAGAVAALSFAAPASAHSGGLGGAFGGCGPTAGKWKVDWKITNDWPTTGTIDVFTSTSDAPIRTAGGTVIANKSTVPARPKNAPYGELDGVQVLDASVASVTLTIHLHWADDQYSEPNRHTVTVTRPEGQCESAPPPPSPSPTQGPKHSPSPSPTHSPSPAATPSTTPGGGSGGGLPVTGVSTMAFGGVALALIGGGTGLVLLGRRRRTSDTPTD